MIALYFIAGCIVVSLVFYFLHRENKTKKKINKPVKMSSEKVIQFKMASKNKWLHPTDNFGKMEKSIAYESKPHKIVNKTSKVKKISKEITINSAINSKNKPLKIN